MTPLEISRIRFTPGLLPSLAALLGVVLTVYLGQWQQGRAQEKRAHQSVLDARASEPPMQVNRQTLVPPRDQYRRASVLGVYDGAGQFYIDNKSHAAGVGYHVITPLKIAQSDRWILVNRGWISRAASYPTPPMVSSPVGLLTVSGMLTVPSQKFLELSANVVDGAVWQNFTIDRYAAATGRQTEALVLLADTSAPLQAVTERPDARVEKHVEYMLTWYSLAVTIVLIWLVLNLKFNRSAEST